MDYVNWVMTHKTELMAAVGGIVTLASMIVKLTPSTKDDEAFMRIMKALALTPKK